MNEKNNNKSYTDQIKISSTNLDFWDIDCDCNLLNDLTGDYGFHEDRGTIDK